MLNFISTTIMLQGKFEPCHVNAPVATIVKAFRRNSLCYYFTRVRS